MERCAAFSYPFLGSAHNCRRRGGTAVASSNYEQQETAMEAALMPKFSKRFTLGVLTAAALGLGADFLGITSQLLGTNPEAARRLRLDVIYPVQGFLRCLDTDRGFEFIYPQDWVGDQRILYRSVEIAEKARSLDLPALTKKPGNLKPIAEPVTAFGPPGTDGELNVSVIVASVSPGFSLDKLGDAREAGELILKKFIAPEGSSKVATLVDAQKTSDGKATYYNLEYSVKGPGFHRHNVAVYTASGGRLFSLNVQTPETEWLAMKSKLVKISGSFKLI